MEENNREGEGRGGLPDQFIRRRERFFEGVGEFNRMVWLGDERGRDLYFVVFMTHAIYLLNRIFSHLNSEDKKEVESLLNFFLTFKQQYQYKTEESLPLLNEQTHRIGELLKKYNLELDSFKPLINV